MYNLMIAVEWSEQSAARGGLLDSAHEHASDVLSSKQWSEALWTNAG